MAKIDWEEERERLKQLYSAMQDAELETVAEEADSLTEVARAELRSEMLQRKMQAPPEAKTGEGIPESTVAHPNPVIVGRYGVLPDALLAKSVLDSAGIESFLADKNMVRLGWSNLVGGIKLMVREEDADTAKKLLDQTATEPAAET